MTTEQMDQIDRILAKALLPDFIIRHDGVVWNYNKSEEWHPTRYITQALGDVGPSTVVGEMTERGYNLNFETYKYHRYKSEIVKTIVAYFTPQQFNWEGFELKEKQSTTPALAICIAACAALGIDIEAIK